MITRANVSEECWSEPFIALRLNAAMPEGVYDKEYRCWEYNRKESQDADTIHGIKHVTQADILVLNINDELMAYSPVEFNEKFASEDIEDLLDEKQEEPEDAAEAAEEPEPEIVAASIKPKK